MTSTLFRTTSKLTRALRAAALAAMVFLLAAVACPQEARADEPVYTETRIEGLSDAVGFEWVERNGDVPAHYSVFNPIPDDPVQHESAVGWWSFAKAAAEYDFSGYLVTLDSDIDFDKFEFNRDSDAGRKQLSVGSPDLPFAGTFDGQGYTLKNLNNERSDIVAVANCGFFGKTVGAIIKNVNFQDCYVGASYCGGVVVGSAKDTFLLNVTCERCTSSVIPGNNVISLITNAGLMGGMLAGEADGSTFYNCEMRAGRVVCSATQGVAALGGQPLYLGALVGAMNDSVIEYCRVTDIMDESGNRTYADVTNKYDTAVSVASYSELFTGGVVGMMQGDDTGSKVVDSFSTAKVYTYAKIDFGLGLGLGVTRGYTGGIAGIVRETDKEENLIQRVSYAGNLSSYNYNIIALGIPAPETDKYIGGITGRGGDNARIDQAYYMRSLSSPDADILAVKTTYSGGYADGAAFGPRDDSYDVRDFWEGQGFDFAGGTLRNESNENEIRYEFTGNLSESEWSKNHYNKWVMDYNRGIPVHGGSIKATLDFPGAGSVTIGATGLASDEGDVQTTSDPYDFAVQGYMAGDDPVEIAANMTTEVPVGSSWECDAKASGGNNEGYREAGWYRMRGVKVNDIAQNHAIFLDKNGVLGNGTNAVLDEGCLIDEPSADVTDSAITLHWPDSDEAQDPTDYADNDLYVLKAQAMVLLHDASGSLVDVNGAQDSSTDDDWYDYGKAITLPGKVTESEGAAAPSTTATLIGWTTQADLKTGADLGYSAITSTDLADLKARGAFYELGATYTVTEAANLYPVYSDYISNVNVVYEGNERDAVDDDTLRDGYGAATVEQDGNRVYVKVTGAGADGAFPDGVRFLGWYERVTYVDNQGIEHPIDLRVSKEQRFYLDDVDLTRTHTYEARFEYRVDYMYYPADDVVKEWTYFAQLWETYKSEFESIAGPTYKHHQFDHWATHEDNTTARDSVFTCNDASHAYDDAIVAPVIVDAHNTTYTGGNDHIVVTTDFPAGPTVWGEAESLYYHYRIEANDLNDSNGSNDKSWWFHGWTADKSDKLLLTIPWPTTSLERDWNPGYLATTYGGTNNYWVEAHVTAKVEFVQDVTKDPCKIVQRTYEQKVLLDEDVSNTYAYHFDDTASGLSSTSAASPSADEMKVEGLVFLGWVDVTEMNDKDSPNYDPDLYNYLFQPRRVDGGVYFCTSDVSRIEPYLIDEEAVCTGPMELQAVYTRFDIETTSNIAEAGVIEGAGINTPKDPSMVDAKTLATDEIAGTVSVNYNNDGGAVLDKVGTENVSADVSYTADARARVTFTADNGCYVTGSDGTIYQLTGFEVRHGDGAVDEHPATNDDNTLTIEVQAGESYTVVAMYEPLVVVYHLDDDVTKVETRARGDALGKSPDPAYKVGWDMFFLGWTEEGPGSGEGGYVTYDAGDPVTMVSERTVVEHSMELWPVYRQANVPVESNIDEKMNAAGDDPADYRYVEWGDGDATLVAKDYPGYRFDGWYTGYGVDDGTDTQLTSSYTHRLSGDALFAGITYTAVYTETYTVQYHGTDNSVIYAASVAEDESRGFLTTVDVPLFDKDGNPVLNEDGTQKTEQVEAVVDVAAFSAIEQQVEKSNENNPNEVEKFSTWRLKKGADDFETWNADDTNNFTRQGVVDLCKSMNTKVLDLYPVTNVFTATDASGASYTSKLLWGISNDDGGGLTVAAALTVPYAQPQLKVNVASRSYNGAGTPLAEGAGGVPVTLYQRFDEGFQKIDDDVTRMDSTGADGLDAGDALFEFDGTLAIVKETTDARAAGAAFSFAVSAGDEERTVTVKVGDSPNDEGVYSGQAVLSVPCGTYRVSENAQWAWRYKPTVRVWNPGGGEDGSGAWVTATDADVAGAVEVSVQYGNAGEDASASAAVKVENVREDSAWVDGFAFVKNLLGGQNAGGE